MTHIRVELGDSLFLKENHIHVCVANKEYVFLIESVEKIVLFTTDLGPFYDDMGLAVDVGNDTAIFIMSEHKCFQTFLFEQIGKVLTVDFEKVIEASKSVENNVFVIYEKNG